MSSSKLLVVGLDGATFDLLEPWVENGLLPTFARLLREGGHARLRSVPNTDTAPAWATFAIGLNPANHGLFHEFNWSSDRRVLYRVKGADRQGESFWCSASKAGLKTIIINVPFTYPVEEIRGVMLAGVDAPAINAPGFCYPPEFIRNVLRRVTDYRIESDIQTAIKKNSPDQGLVDAYGVARGHTETMIYMMSEIDWDLAVIVYSIPDVMQHFFWQQMVTNSGPQREAIQDGYIFIDGQIERLLNHAGEKTTVLIMSDHGFGPLCATPDYLSQWLAEKGFLHYLKPSQRSLREKYTANIYNWLSRYLSESQKAMLRRRLSGLRNRIESGVRFSGIDWAKTIAYVGPSPYEILINCQGREPQGIVPPGKAYEEIRETLIKALLDWRDPETHKQKVQAVHRAEEVYQGQYLKLAPDITIEWNLAAAPLAKGLVGNKSQFDADHASEGILIVAGPNIRRGVKLKGANLTDVAPTILSMLNVEQSWAVDGRVLTDLLESA